VSAGRTAVLVEAGPDKGAVWHYGDPVAEQRAWLDGCGLVDLGHRGVLRVDGPDRLSWLHSLTTQSLEGLAAGVSTETLVLSPNGHIEHALHLVDDGAAAWITVEPGTATALVEWLDRMRFMLRVEVSDVSEDWAVVAEPSLSSDSVSRAGTVTWQDPWPTVADGSVSYAPDGVVHPAEGLWRVRELLVPRSELRELVAGSAAPCGIWAHEALRVEARRPRLGFETDHRTLPHEVDWLRTAVHLQKGCYRGQETVARVHNLGRPPRRLVLLHLDGSEVRLPAHGDEVRLLERPVGLVTSAARHHELGPVALALVKRNVPVAETLTVDGLAAAQEIVVAP
jgi:tRNA-modifying protein YgfZ